MWHGSARPAFLVTIWQCPLAAHIWRVLPHGKKNIADTHSNVTSNIIHSCLLTSQKLVLFPFYHPIKMELTLVVSWNRKHWPGRSRPIFHKLTWIHRSLETTQSEMLGFLAATKQLYEWYFLSVCPSVCLSVTPFWLCSHHRIITKFSGVITNDRSDIRAKGQGQRSKVKVTEVTTQLNRFRTVTPVWIHICWWNHAYDLMILRIGALLFFRVIRQISRSHGSKKRRIWPR